MNQVKETNTQERENSSKKFQFISDFMHTDSSWTDKGWQLLQISCLSPVLVLTGAVFFVCVSPVCRIAGAVCQYELE
jgi:hypothetical protein